MAVVCAHCGEELMGAVNRCWKCGKPLVAHAGRQDIPPVRRSPIVGPLDAALEAVIIADTPTTPGKFEPRRGSPFTVNTATIRVAGAIQRAIPEEPKRLRPPRAFESHVAAQIAGIVSLVLGMVALGISLAVPIGAVCIAPVVISFGIWGLYAQKRTAAIFGLILGCVALALGGFGTVVQVYELLYGVHPFATSPQLPPAMSNP